MGKSKIYINIYTYIHIYICRHIYIYIYIHTCTHVHIHTYKENIYIGPPAGKIKISETNKTRQQETIPETNKTRQQDTINKTLMLTMIQFRKIAN